MSKRIWLLGALATLACGSDSSGPAADVPAALVGEWVAEPACAPPCAFTLTSVDNEAARLDAVSMLGLTVRVQVSSSGTFTRSGSGTPATGQVRGEGALLIVTDSRGVTDTIDYRIEGEFLHLDFRRLFVEVDFDQDEVLDPARVAGVFRRH